MTPAKPNVLNPLNPYYVDFVNWLQDGTVPLPENPAWTRDIRTVVMNQANRVPLAGGGTMSLDEAFVAGYAPVRAGAPSAEFVNYIGPGSSFVRAGVLLYSWTMKTMKAIWLAALVVATTAFAADAPAKKLNVLAVCAHPDDVEYSVGGTLLRYAREGHHIYIALTTSGNTGSSEKKDPAEIGRLREAEQLASAKLYGAEVRFLRADDERLLDTNEMRTRVLDALRWADPDVVFTQSPTDESPDHWATAELVQAMVLSLPGINQQSSEKPCEKKVSVFTWENDACVGSRQPEVYVDISDVMDAKLKAFRLHRSQVS